MIMNMARTTTTASDTLATPYFLTETDSSSSKGSLPNIASIRGRRRKATGTRDMALIPMRPSAKQSTARPVPKAMNIAQTVPIFGWMNRTSTGRMVSIT